MEKGHKLFAITEGKFSSLLSLPARHRLVKAQHSELGMHPASGLHHGMDAQRGAELWGRRLSTRGQKPHHHQGRIKAASTENRNPSWLTLISFKKVF